MSNQSPACAAAVGSVTYVAMRSGSNKTKFPWLPMFLADFMAIVGAYYTTIFLRFHSDLGERIYGTLPKLIADQRMGEVGVIHEVFYYESALRIILILTATLCLLYALQNLYAGRRFQTGDGRISESVKDELDIQPICGVVAAHEAERRIPSYRQKWAPGCLVSCPGEALKKSTAPF